MTDKKGYGLPLDMTTTAIIFIIVVIVIIIVLANLLQTTPSGVSGTKDTLIDTIIGWFT